MNSTHLAEGDVLFKRSAGTRHRVLYLNRDEIVVIKIGEPGHSVAKQAKPPLPELWQTLSVLDGLNSGAIERELMTALFPQQRDLSDAEKRYQARAYTILARFTDSEPFIYYPECRSKLVAEVARALNVSRQNIYKLLRVYWLYGKNITAVISNYHRCGAPGQDRMAGERKLGRPRRAALVAAHGNGVNVRAEDKENIRRAVAYLKAATHPRLKDAYRWVLSRHYSIERVESDGRRSLVTDSASVMTLGQFEYHLRKLLNPNEKTELRSRFAKTTKKTRRRTSGQHASNPECGEIGEIDALHANVSLVSELDRAQVLGSAIIVVIVEYYSELIIGIALGWDGEEYETFVDAILCAARDKHEWCAERGIDLASEDWPAAHLPQRFHADKTNALLGKLSDRIPAALSPNPFSNAPGMEPEAKGGVENTVRLLKAELAMLPGSWMGKIGNRERGAKNPHQDATCTRKEFLRFLVEKVVKVNVQVREGTATRPDLVVRDVPHSPIAIYKDALDLHRHCLRRVDAAVLRDALLQRVTGRVGDRGIYVGDELYYLPTRDSDLNSIWYQNLEAEGAQVEIARDRRTVDVAFLVRPGLSGPLIPCRLTPRSARFAQMSLSEVKQLRSRRTEIDQIEQMTRLPHAVATTAKQLDDARRAHESTRKALGYVPPSQRDIGHRRENRQLEKKYERAALSPPNEVIAAPPSGVGTRTGTTDAERLAFPDLDDL